MRSYKPEVFVQGEWSTNSLRFATEEEAAAYASDLYMRWTLTEKHRAVPSDDPVNCRWDKEKGLVRLVEGEVA